MRTFLQKARTTAQQTASAKPPTHDRPTAGMPRMLLTRAEKGSVTASSPQPAFDFRQGLQTKLQVNQPGDIYEQEADRVAEQVSATPTHTDVSSAAPRIQRFLGQSNGQVGAAPASVDSALASPGRPLEPALRRDMEQRLGHDFSRVRVHSDAASEMSARQLDAQAYTSGYDIVFGLGRFAPATPAGRRLLAHELTHVVQQTRETDGLQTKLIQRDGPQKAPDVSEE
jgi:hypothetical protein